MIKKTIRVGNEKGIHARPAGIIVNAAGRFASEVKIQKDGMEVNCKSIMGVLMLAAGRGEELTVVCSGPDEAQAAEAVSALFSEAFEFDRD
jgi:phosphocarrier protein HPr